MENTGPEEMIMKKAYLITNYPDLGKKGDSGFRDSLAYDAKLRISILGTHYEYKQLFAFDN